MKLSYRIGRIAAASLLAVAVLLSATTVFAQSELEKTLKQLSSEAVKGYIQPVADMFGANMNAGFYRSAKIPNSGFVFAFDLIGMGSLVGDGQKTYDFPLPTGFNPVGGSRQTATVFGGKGTLFTDQATGLQFRGSDGIVNTSIFPLAVPQITIGSLYGTTATLRLIAIPKIGGKGDTASFPSTTLWALGLRHSISQYFTDSPVDLAAGLYFSNMHIGDLISFNGVSFGAQASKSFSILTVYGGLAYEKSTLKLSYQFTDLNGALIPVDISLDGANNFRATAGLALDFYVLHIFADANFGTVTNFSGGIGFGY